MLARLDCINLGFESRISFVDISRCGVSTVMRVTDSYTSKENVRFKRFMRDVYPGMDTIEKIELEVRGYLFGKILNKILIF